MFTELTIEELEKALRDMSFELEDLQESIRRTQLFTVMEQGLLKDIDEAMLILERKKEECDG